MNFLAIQLFISSLASRKLIETFFGASDINNRKGKVDTTLRLKCALLTIVKENQLSLFTFPSHVSPGLTTKKTKMDLSGVRREFHRDNIFSRRFSYTTFIAFH
jgi:hypothetical protein